MYGRRSQESDSQRPLGNVNYSQAYQQDQGGNQYDGQYGSAGYGAGRSATPKKKSKKGLWIGLGLLLVLIAAGATVGGVLGSRAAKNNRASTVASSNGVSGSTNADGSPATGSAATRTAGSANGAVVPTATDANGNPLYPTATGSAVLTAPTFTSNSALSCGADPYTFDNPSSLSVRTDHPRLFAPKYKWACLPKLIAADSYMSSWNATIFGNATRFAAMSPTNYSIDGGLTGSGVLDVSREVQLRIKHWGYAYQMSKDTKWVDRTWLELQTAAGNNSGQYFGVAGNNWNSGHFLDLAEFTMAFAIAYDWMYDAWTPTQREAIMWSIINLGLNYGANAYTGSTSYSWWTKVNGNWNCVCNNGLTAGALAIAGDDPTGVAAALLAQTVPNAAANCAFGPSPDGTWSETANYWYFGTGGHSQMAAALLTATGSTQNLLDVNPGMKLSALYHMYVTGMQGLFAYGDTGPNKYSTTANGIMFYGSQYNIPMYTLFQRDRGDAPEPMSMLFYDPQVSGQFWNGLPLDHYFTNTSDAWISMRSSWTSTQGIYVAMKAGGLQGHQTHQDIDTGTFVFDALGQRFAGELGSGDYLAEGYFSSESQNSERWDYYRTRTEGQNTLLMGGLNQNVLAIPTTNGGTSGDSQLSLDYAVNTTSTAYFTADLTSTYNGTSIHRGIRLLNSRKQILLQDEIVAATLPIQWRMHTNATVSISNAGKTATLLLNGQTVIAQLASPSTASFTTQSPLRLSTDPTLPAGALSADQPNPGVTVLVVALPAGSATVQVLFNPQWPGMAASAFVSAKSVPIASWSLTSHN